MRPAGLRLLAPGHSCSVGSRGTVTGNLRAVETTDIALLIIRVSFGVSLAYHGWNKIFGGGGLAGTSRWFESLGMRAPALQARLAAGTEIAAGLAFAAGLLTPIAAAATVGLMLVAIATVHGRVGYFIFLPDGGWEYCAAIAAAAIAVGTAGAGEISLDHALGIHWGWWGLLIAAVGGATGAAAQLAAFWRPPARGNS